MLNWKTFLASGPVGLPLPRRARSWLEASLPARATVGAARAERRSEREDNFMVRGRLVGIILE